MEVLLYGAAGHTGRFIARELVRQGFTPLLAGRNGSRLNALRTEIGGVVAECSIDDRAQIDALVRRSVAVINAAGPFGDTSPQLIEAAVATRRPYFDISGEPFVVRDLFERFDRPARDAGVLVAPGFGFFGALGDLLASAAMADWTTADSIDLACALDSWKPTKGSRLAGERRAGRRLIWSGDRLSERSPDEKAPRGSWTFAAPFGEQETLGEFSTVDVVSMSRHLRFGRLSTWVNLAPLADLQADDGRGPTAIDSIGRSDQRFLLEVLVTRGGEHRRMSASGKDIYAITAPLIVKAMSLVLAKQAGGTGALSAGQFLDPQLFLDTFPAELLLIYRGGGEGQQRAA